MNGMPDGYEHWINRPVTPENTALLIAEAERKGAVKALRALASERDALAADSEQNLTTRTVSRVISEVIDNRADFIQRGGDF